MKIEYLSQFRTQNEAPVPSTGPGSGVINRNIEEMCLEMYFLPL